MNDFLEQYRIKLVALAPVFIGSGQALTKKEYVFQANEKKLQVIDFEQLFMEISDNKKLGSLQRFLMKNSSEGFNDWLDKEEIEVDPKWVRYELDLGESEQVFYDINYHGISMFQKDAFGCPFIPGSSLKGALRTALLKNKIGTSSNVYGDTISTMNKIKNDPKKNRKDLLKELAKQSKDFEKSIFMSQEFTGSYNHNVDAMRGFRISDSKPLQLSDLILCQKVDVHTDSNQSNNELPILRECLKPGTEIECTLTLDRTCFKPSIDEIRGAISKSSESIHAWLEQNFQCDKLLDDNVIYLGGGVGYLSKTVTYDLLSDSDATDLSRKVLPNVEEREQDEVVPRVMKTTNFAGKSYEMGLCRIEFEKM